MSVVYPTFCNAPRRIEQQKPPPPPSIQSGPVLGRIKSFSTGNKISFGIPITLAIRHIDAYMCAITDLTLGVSG